MAKLTIRSFLGIAPRQEQATAGATTFAKVAKDVDLFNGICQPFKADQSIEGSHSGPDFIWHRGGFLSGIESPVSMFSGDQETAIYRRAGEWYKRVLDSEVSLGISQPDEPTLSDTSMYVGSPPTITNETGHPEGWYLPAGEYAYFTTYIRNIAGRETEGKASIASVATPYSGDDVPRYHTINRPLSYPPKATGWNLYRSFNDSPPQLVTSYPINATVVTDVYPQGSLGRFLGEVSNETSEKYRFTYVITWERTVNGNANESGPSPLVTLEQDTIGMEITRPSSYPSGTQTWNIYRISTNIKPTTDFELVARVPIADTVYEDVSQNEDLGIAIPTSYESNLGFVVQASPPPAEFDGIYGPHNGMLIGWKDANLYYSEPGKVDYWSEFYKLEAKANIVGCVSLGGTLAVITTRGVQLISGSEPLLLTLSDTLTGHGGVDPKAICVGRNGAFFLTHDGICQILSNGQTDLITDESFTQEYFNDINASSVDMRVYNNKLYLVHDAGALVLDLTRGVYFNLSEVYLAILDDRENGRLAGLKADGNIYEVGGNSLPLDMDYQTGDIVLSDPTHKRFNEVEFYGSGQVDLTVYIDGSVAISKSIDMDGIKRKRTAKIPRKFEGRGMSLSWTGTGTITEITMDVVKAPIEVTTS